MTHKCQKMQVSDLNQSFVTLLVKHKNLAIFFIKISITYLLTTLCMFILVYQSFYALDLKTFV